MMNDKKVILLCGGGSGCVTNIICDRLLGGENKDDYMVIVAGRTPMKQRSDDVIPFIFFDLLEEDAIGNLVKDIKHLLKKLCWKDGVSIGKIDAIINCISTGTYTCRIHFMVAFTGQIHSSM